MSKYAYVALLYKTSIYYLGALMLAKSLRDTKTKAKLVLMYKDVSDEQLNELKKYYDELINVDYILAPKLIHNYPESRFKEVFTKFNCFKLTQYDKILMIDIDMLVVQNMDHLFELKTPAALKRGPKIYKNGEKISINEFERDGKMISGINAGLMLFEPNMKTFNDIMKTIQNPPKTYVPARDPEQAFISWYYRDKWYNISHLYNYQFTLGTIFPHKYNQTQKPFNIHYSSPTKPWNFIGNSKGLDKNPYKKYYLQWIEEFKKIKNYTHLMSLF